MTRAKCSDCGRGFMRDADETWKTRCIDCFKKSKRADSTTADSYWISRATAAELRADSLERQLSQRTSGLDRELAGRIRQLLQYCHPDKHGGSQGATQVTQWLNDLKGRLSCG